MDSLLASYASSDEEEEASPQVPQQHHNQSESQIRTLTSNSSQFSIPRPQSTSSPFSSLFSSLPPPNSQPDPISVARSFDTIPNPKRVVQFRPPVIPSPASFSKLNDDDDEEEDEDLDRKKHQVAKQSTSAKSFIFSMPAPKNSSALGAGAVPGSGRRATIEASGPSSNSDGFKAENEVGAQRAGCEEGKLDTASISSSFEAIETQSGEGTVGVSEATTWVQTDQSYPGYDNYGNNDGYAGYQYENPYGQYDQSNWSSDSPAAYLPDTSATAAYAAAETVAKISGKRGRDRIPTEIVEVSQDELMKNRPRQDQVKSTGIAFGPAYQPATSSGGKPTKLHKRKHQIGSLYFEMKQKELELAERRSKGMLTKAQTQGKYGW